MRKPHRNIKQPPKKYMGTRKYNGKCEDCQEKTPSSEIFQRVDENNYAITYNAKYLCRNCYIKNHGVDPRPSKADKRLLSACEEATKKLTKTLELHDKIKEVVAPVEYNSPTRKEYLCFYVKHDLENELYNRAMIDIYVKASKLIGLNRYNDPLISYDELRWDNSKDYMQHYKNYCKKIMSIDNEAILEDFNRSMLSYHTKEMEVDIKGDIITLKKSTSITFVINILNILKNNKLECTEIINKLSDLKENTFIYRDVKITHYQNGNIKLNFADDELKKAFIKVLDSKKAVA